ncbi:LysR substrate-binding domain-containing protein [Oceanimonas sp. NS1]|nr:LysR substrate-binding domain-containing protein [Oceanimonas sp. NS1]
MTVNDVINEQVIDMVQDGQVELGIAFEPPPSTRLQFIPLYRDRFVAVVPADAELASNQEVTWRQLLTQPFITLQRPRRCGCCWSSTCGNGSWPCRWHLKATSSPPWAEWWAAAWASAWCRRCAGSRCTNWCLLHAVDRPGD